ncbi:hypothetical protein LSQ66_07015 [Massilia endophytica]|nr:hypothetical protein [Massilia endophytica]UGQ48209.1 hypothetical protein LSQ66_07015 [Massilia endophytica]
MAGCALGNITAIKQQLTFSGERVSHQRKLGTVAMQTRLANQGRTQLERARFTVTEHVYSPDVGAPSQHGGDLRQTIVRAVDQDKFDAFPQPVDQRLVVGNRSIDKGDFFGSGCNNSGSHGGRLHLVLDRIGEILLVNIMNSDIISNAKYLSKRNDIRKSFRKDRNRQSAEGKWPSPNAGRGRMCEYCHPSMA